jgi:uncharacterized protein
MTGTSTFRAPWFARNPHLQTLWGKFVAPEPPVEAVRVTWQTPDGDDVVVIRANSERRDVPRFVLFHGLEGTERSHYVPALFRAAADRGWAADMLLWRSCGGANNRAARFYHSGETDDASWFLHRLAELYPSAPLIACGVSLGGNVLTKLIGDASLPLPANLRAAVGVSVPFDLERGSRFISQGASRMYEKWFLRSLRAKATEKASRYPDRFPSAERIAGIRTLWEFDDIITAPLHGFDGATDYYTRSSAKHFVHAARIPLLLLSAADDPFLPPDVLEDVRERARHNPLVQTEFVRHGGHVGFVTGDSPRRSRSYLADRIPAFLAQHLAGIAEGGRNAAGPDRPQSTIELAGMPSQLA